MYRDDATAEAGISTGGGYALMACSVVGTWKVRDWRCGKQLAEQNRLRQDGLAAISDVTAAQVLADQGKGLPTEQRLPDSIKFTTQN